MEYQLLTYAIKNQNLFTAIRICRIVVDFNESLFYLQGKTIINKSCITKFFGNKIK